MIRRLSAGLAVLVLAGTALVAVGVGQGAPPAQFPLSAAAQAREVRAIAHAGPEVKRGEVLFNGHGCDACHTIAAGGYHGRLGPRLDVQSPGVTAAQIEGSITDPPHEIPGYEPGLMPENFAERLPAKDIRALAAFVAAAANAADGHG
jgi:cytochrome c553